jgi:hypothetical protein
MPESNKTTPALVAVSEPEGRKHIWSEARQAIRIAYRDPQHVAERIALRNTARLGQPSLEWSQRARAHRPDVPRAVIAEEQRIQSSRLAALDGAVAGTPFLLALVPGYVVYLRQEVRLVLRIAALYDRDPRDIDAAADLLALRGVHPSVDAARSALLQVQATPMPDKPAKRRPLRTWVHSVYVLLILGGFLSPHADGGAQPSHPRLKTALAAIIGIAVWLTTWVFPLTFMIAMAWGCDTNARTLGLRALIFYDGEPESAKAAIAAAKKAKEPGHLKRQIVRGVALTLSIGIPVAFLAYVDAQRQSTGITGLSALGALVGLSLVIAAASIATRR